ncbi:MAG: class I SAM-dependent methyltransferase [Prochlorococcaceae cyanobacterium]
MAPGSSWSHGYFAGTTYTSGFYVELAPQRLDFSALVKGHRSPRPQPGASFRYLELGSGTGFGLCLMAAAHPEGAFVGVDFLPDHIAHSQWLARELGLSNVRFLEADFLALEKDPRPLDPTEPDEAKGFHYVVAHGIAAWVSEPVQQSLLALASSQLRPGGLFYCSYNTYPGWLGRRNFHMLASLERRINQPSAPLKALETARTTLQALAGNDQLLGRSLPQLDAELDGIGAMRNTSYLLGEYGTDSWAPLYVAEMHGRCQEHKLTFLATATLPELFEELLPEPSRSLVAKETNPTLHQVLFDLAINQSFRRDIFVKGPLPLRKHQREQALSELSITLMSTQPASQKRITTSFNELELDATLTGAIESALAEGPCTVGDLCLVLGRGVSDLLLTLALLIHHGRIALHRGASTASAATTTTALAVNRRLRDLMQEGHIFDFLVAPAIGAALGFSPLEALVLETIEQGLDDETAIGCVLMGLDAISGHLNDAAGLPIHDPQLQVEALRTYLNDFRETALPQLRRLGAIQGPSNLEESS